MGQQLDTNGMVMHEWRHYLTADEIQERKDLSLKLSDEIDKIEEDKKASADDFNKQIKERKLHEKRARVELKIGHIDKRDCVKPMLDYARGVVEFFDQNGDKVDERKMTRQEQRDGLFVHN